MTIAVRVVVAAHKGGVGKSVITAGVAGALAQTGVRVLVVDTDHQGGAGALLGVPSPTSPTLYEVLTAGVPATRAIVTTTTPGLYLLPATRDLAAADLDLPHRSGWRRQLAGALDAIPTDAVDLVLIDTPPGLGVLPVMALTASTHVLVVTELEHLAIRALADGLETIRQVVTTGGGAPRLIGIVPNRVAGQATLHQNDAAEVLTERYRRWVLPSVPARVAVRNAGVAGIPITIYDPDGAASAAITTIAREVHRRAIPAPPAAQHA